MYQYSIFLSKGFITVGVLTYSVLFLFCSVPEPDHHHEEDHQHETGEHYDSVHLSRQNRIEFDIEVDTAGPGVLHSFMELTGEIRTDPMRVAHMVPRFPGIVKSVDKRIGDRVVRGDTLALVESNESLSIYPVQSLTQGTVIDMHLSLGEVVRGDSPIFTIADLSTVWADLDIYQEDMLVIKTGQNVELTSPSYPDIAHSTLSYISPVVDETTQTATGRAILDNRSGNWKPGMYINARVTLPPKEVDIAVPVEALQEFEGETVIFIQDEDEFIPRPVHVGRKTPDRVEIVSGLNNGERYVSRGAFTLKAELQKEFFGGHVH